MSDQNSDIAYLNVNMSKQTGVYPNISDHVCTCQIMFGQCPVAKHD